MVVAWAYCELGDLGPRFLVAKYVVALAHIPGRALFGIEVAHFVLAQVLGLGLGVALQGVIFMI